MDKEKVRCISCEEMVDEDMASYSEKVDGFVCEGCLEHDEQYANTVIIHHKDEYDGYVNEDGNSVCRVGEYIDETNGEFEFDYVRTDAWRGYYVAKSKQWINIHSDCILVGSGDSRELENFDEKIRNVLDKLELPYARVFSMSSNVFSQGYDLFIRKEGSKKFGEIMQLMGIIAHLKEKYRDSDRFAMTAITGKDEFDVSDNFLLSASEKIMKGATAEDFRGKLEAGMEA
jgi:hypothetical protein